MGVSAECLDLRDEVPDDGFCDIKSPEGEIKSSQGATLTASSTRFRKSINYAVLSEIDTLHQANKGDTLKRLCHEIKCLTHCTSNELNPHIYITVQNICIEMNYYPYNLRTYFVSLLYVDALRKKKDKQEQSVVSQLVDRICKVQREQEQSVVQSSTQWDKKKDTELWYWMTENMDHKELAEFALAAPKAKSYPIDKLCSNFSPTDMETVQEHMQDLIQESMIDTIRKLLLLLYQNEEHQITTTPSDIIDTTKWSNFVENEIAVMTVEHLLVYVTQIATQLAYLHNDIKYIHTDINLDNIVINPKTHACSIIDFGCAQKINMNIESMGGFVGWQNFPTWRNSNGFWAPELCNREPSNTIRPKEKKIEQVQIDIHSFGRVLETFNAYLSPEYDNKGIKNTLNAMIKTCVSPNTRHLPNKRRSSNLPDRYTSMNSILDEIHKISETIPPPSTPPTPPSPKRPPPGSQRSARPAPSCAP